MNPEQIVSSKCVLGPDQYVKSADLRELFKESHNMYALGKWLKKKYGVVSKTKRIGTIVATCYIGISIKPA
jgi:hypothetical protein